MFVDIVLEVKLGMLAVLNNIHNASTVSGFVCGLTTCARIPNRSSPPGRHRRQKRRCRQGGWPRRQISMPT